MRKTRYLNRLPLDHIAIREDKMGLVTNYTTGHQLSSAMLIYYIAIPCVYVPGFITNLFAVIIFLKSVRQNKFPANTFLLATATTDICALTASAIRHGVRRFIAVKWTSLCVCMALIGPIFSLFAGMVQAMMAFDRCLSLCKPLFYKRVVTLERVRRLFPIAVAVALVVSFLPFIGLGDFIYTSSRGGSSSVRCSTLFYQQEAMKRVFAFIFILLGLLNVVVVLACNFVVSMVVFRMKVLSYQTESQATRRISTQLKFTKMICALSATFLLCWGPYYVSTVNMCGNSGCIKIHLYVFSVTLT